LHSDDLPFDYYGAQNNEFALSSGKLAPIGWRIPSKADIVELENYLSNNGYLGVVGNGLAFCTKRSFIRCRC